MRPGWSPIARRPASTPGVNEARSSESWRIVRVSPTPPRMTSWWATRPRTRSAVHADAVDVGAAGAVEAGATSRRAPAPQPGLAAGGGDQLAPYAGRCRRARRPCRGGAARRPRPTRRTGRPRRRSASSGSRRWRSSGRSARRCPGASASQPRSVSSRVVVEAGGADHGVDAVARCRTRRLSITTSGWVKSTTASAPGRDQRPRGRRRRRPARPARGPSAASTARHTSDADLAARAEHAHPESRVSAPTLTAANLGHRAHRRVPVTGRRTFWQAVAHGCCRRFRRGSGGPST